MKNNVGSIPAFVIIAKQCCAGLRPFHFLTEELGGDRNRAADLNWPKRYSVLHDIVWKESFEGVRVHLALLLTEGGWLGIGW